MRSKHSSIPITATHRLKQDYIRLKKDPVPFVTAEPLSTNILEWHYVITGPDDTPYTGGFYHGKLVFPREFPFKPPAIYMITPNGRFKCNQRLCLSISDFHPDTWNPAWSVTTILTGLLSFMVEDTPTLGSIETTRDTKLRLASSSKDHNMQNNIFIELFPDIVEEIKKQKADEIASHENSESGSAKVNSNQNSPEHLNEEENDGPGFSSLFVVIGVIAFAFFVDNVVKTLN